MFAILCVCAVVVAFLCLEQAETIPPGPQPPSASLHLPHTHNAHAHRAPSRALRRSVSHSNTWRPVVRLSCTPVLRVRAGAQRLRGTTGNRRTHACTAHTTQQGKYYF